MAQKDDLVAALQRCLKEHGIEAERVERTGEVQLHARTALEERPLHVHILVSTELPRASGSRALAYSSRQGREIFQRPTLSVQAASATQRGEMRRTKLDDEFEEPKPTDP